MLLREDFDPFWRYRAGSWTDGAPGDAVAHRPDEESRALPARPPLVVELVQGPRADLGGRGRGVEQQSQTTTKKAYGFRTYRCLEIALYHTLGHLPEPEHAHRFCWEPIFLS